MTIKQKRGFAAMSPEKQKEIASMGGKAAVNRHRFTSENAKISGSKGGKVSQSNRRLHAAAMDYDRSIKENDRETLPPPSDYNSFIKDSKQ